MKKTVSVLLVTSLMAGPLLFQAKEAQAHRSEGKFALGVAILVGVGLAITRHHPKKHDTTTSSIQGNSHFFASNKKSEPLKTKTFSDALLLHSASAK